MWQLCLHSHSLKIDPPIPLVNYVWNWKFKLQISLINLIDTDTDQKPLGQLVSEFHSHIHTYIGFVQYSVTVRERKNSKPTTTLPKCDHFGLELTFLSFFLQMDRIQPMVTRQVLRIYFISLTSKFYFVSFSLKHYQIPITWNAYFSSSSSSVLSLFLFVCVLPAGEYVLVYLIRLYPIAQAATHQFSAMQRACILDKLKKVYKSTLLIYDWLISQFITKKNLENIIEESLGAEPANPSRLINLHHSQTLIN